VIDLGASVQFVKGVGPLRAVALAQAGVVSVSDLLHHIPLRYEDRRSFAHIAELQPGMKVSVSGIVAASGLRRGRRMSLFEVRLEDATGRLKAIWFNQPYLRDVLAKGRRVVLFGRVEKDAYTRHLVMPSPQHELLESDEAQGIHTGRIVPIYEKLGPLSGNVLRRSLTALAGQIPDDLPDTLPSDVRGVLGVIPLGTALREVHAPHSGDLALLNRFRSPAHVRLILEEFFLFELGMVLRGRGLHREPKSVSFQVTDRVREAVKRILPFHLTSAQKRVLREIANDMKASYPMNRLIQGDVGSGKTIVALLAMVLAVENGYQAAFMAPTEILAEQHYLTFRRLVAPCGYRVETLSSGLKGKDRRDALLRLSSGESPVAVGTHALIQEGVGFRRLGLAVIDEQHRFGVLQREDLRRKGYDVEVLVMTATPIPRTLALTAYGDLDVSLLDERPPGRAPIKTLREVATGRRRVRALVLEQVRMGRQAYVVYPLVEESEKLEDVQAAIQMAGEWRAALGAVRVGLIHGRMPSAEKEAVMSAFACGNIQVLVATTVIEVGLDVPNATIIVIEHAERFGLSQLHQLRGRVGRGGAASTCVLLSSGRLSDTARARLEVMERTDDGFAIAEKDLEIRGPGDFFGTRQWGMPSFRVSQILRDRDLLEQARSAAIKYADGLGSSRGSLHSFFETGAWERRFGLARVG